MSDLGARAGSHAGVAAGAEGGSASAAGSVSPAPLRVGMLGASRIARASIVDASRVTGEELLAVAARDPERARAYAQEHGFAGVREGYGALVNDASVDLVYIGLPNGLHAEWTAAALEAGRSVLVEKPFAANLAEFDRVVARLEAADGWVWEAFHYDDHPLMSRVLELLTAGEIGELREINVSMRMPAPDAADPRWIFDLAGGAMMDVGCYAVHVLHLIAGATGAQLQLQSATAQTWAGDERIDERVDAQLVLADADQPDSGAGSQPVTAQLRASMAHDDVDFSLELIGTRGSITAPCFVKPQEDDRLIVRTATSLAETTIAGEASSETETTREERLGTVATYVYQLERVRAELRGGVRDATRLARSRATMATIDEIYRAAGLPVRPARLAV